MASDTIAYGIDLGTTNSLIARFANGAVEVLRNPRGFRETLPSVVAYRRGKVVVGDGAVELEGKHPGCVVGGFKRRMGTTEAYVVEDTGQVVTPVELSAAVLRELRFMAEGKTGDIIEAVVITVPAAFDLLQSEATRQAGHLAGFERVELLQEPIAASLAFANRTSLQRQDGDRWLVYDLGGGTLDIALVQVYGGEMRVVDHEGDNYLGGRDFDHAVVRELLIPKLAEQSLAEGLSQMHCTGSAHHSLYRRLLSAAEKAKAELSSGTQADIELDLEIDGETVEFAVQVGRFQFEKLIQPTIDRTARMMQELLGRNGLKAADVRFVLFVGGATYSPLVRHRIERTLGIPSASDVDPTNAIAVGAAYYAGMVLGGRARHQAAPAAERAGGLEVAFSYATGSKSPHELLAVKFPEPVPVGHSYRITRQDGDFDTGLKAVASRVYEELPLAMDCLNGFTFALYDPDGRPVPVHPSQIHIAHGTYRVEGQPLPHDICLEVDDLLARISRLETIFAKNSVLPARRTVRRTLSKHIGKDSDDAVDVNVYEGDGESAPAANLCLGQIRISGQEVPAFVVKGTEVELEFSMSGSRELAVTAKLAGCDREFSGVFLPSNRHVEPVALVGQLEALYAELSALHQASRAQEEAGGRAEEIEELVVLASGLLEEARRLRADDATDAKFQIDDRRRKLVQRTSQITLGRDLADARYAYREARDGVIELVGQHGVPEEREKLSRLLERQAEVIRGRNVPRIRAAAEELRGLRGPIQARQPNWPHHLFFWLLGEQSRFQDPDMAARLIAEGDRARQADNVQKLMEINNQLWRLLPNEERNRMAEFELKGIA